MAIDRNAIGFTAESNPFEITSDRIIQYAEATNEDNPAFTDLNLGDGRLLAPPCFAFTYGLESMTKVLMGKNWGIDFLRLVHGEQEFIYHQPVKSGDKIIGNSEITDVEDKETGETITIKTKISNQEGMLLTESKYLFFIRKKGAKKGSPTVGEEANTDYLFETPMKTTDDQATRYGHASGDVNPIHMNPEAGKAAGLGGVILHGLCTMALASKALIDGCAAREAEKLYRLKVRFAKPVIPGDTVTTRVWGNGNEKFGFDVVSQKGDQVIKHGEAQFR